MGKDYVPKGTPFTDEERDRYGRDYAALVDDAALWLFRKYYSTREWSCWEPGRPNQPHKQSRMGCSSVEDLAAELWLVAIKADLFSKAERSGQRVEGYVRKAFHQAVKRAGGTGSYRRGKIKREARLLAPFGRIVGEIAGGASYDLLQAMLSDDADREESEDDFSHLAAAGMSADSNPRFTSERQEKRSIQAERERYERF